jgi:hypothetical protein
MLPRTPWHALECVKEAHYIVRGLQPLQHCMQLPGELLAHVSKLLHEFGAQLGQAGVDQALGALSWRREEEEEEVEGRAGMCCAQTHAFMQIYPCTGFETQWAALPVTVSSISRKLAMSFLAFLALNGLSAVACWGRGGCT